MVSSFCLSSCAPYIHNTHTHTHTHTHKLAIAQLWEYPFLPLITPTSSVLKTDIVHLLAHPASTHTHTHTHTYTHTNKQAQTKTLPGHPLYFCHTAHIIFHFLFHLFPLFYYFQLILLSSPHFPPNPVLDCKQPSPEGQWSTPHAPCHPYRTMEWSRAP